MLSPVGLLLIAAVATGLLVEDCNVDLGDIVITHKVTIRNVSDETMWVSVFGADVGGSFSLGPEGARTVTSYQGGKVTIAGDRYDVAPVFELQTEAVQLKWILATQKLSEAEVKVVNARLSAIGAKLQEISQTVKAAVESPASGQTRMAACFVDLKAGDTKAVEIGTLAGSKEPICTAS